MVLPIAKANVKSVGAIPTADIDVEWFSGTGSGGQHRNKTQNCCRLTHTPTGMTATAQCRKRTQSYNQALEQLTQKVKTLMREQDTASLTSFRRVQAGSGQRSDKIRTYRFQEDVVKDHQSGRSAKLSHILKGRFDLLHKSNRKN